MAEETQEELELDPSLILEEHEEDDQVEEVQAQEPEEDIPEKYRGKSARELVEMHQSAERAIGRQGNELGQIRKVLDDILVAQQQSQPSTAPDVPDMDFFEDPKAATSRIVAESLKNDPTLQSMQKSLQESEKKTKAAQMAQAHPDYLEVAQSADFQQWLAKDNWRVQTFQNAGANFDIEAAASLLSMYKESRQVREATERSAKNQQRRKVNQASTGSGKASAETRGKPKLSREALIELKMTNPDKYMANIRQIKQAYAEGRVE